MILLLHTLCFAQPCELLTAYKMILIQNSDVMNEDETKREHSSENFYRLLRLTQGCASRRLNSQARYGKILHKHHSNKQHPLKSCSYLCMTGKT